MDGLQIDASLVSSALIITITVLGWLMTRAQARDKAFRSELKWRRNQDGLRDRYIHRLESALSKEDLPLPEKPKGYEDEMDKEW